MRILDPILGPVSLSLLLTSSNVTESSRPVTFSNITLPPPPATIARARQNNETTTCSCGEVWHNNDTRVRGGGG